MTYNTHMKRNVKSSHYEIIQFTNELSISSGITEWIHLSWQKFSVQIHKCVSGSTSYHSFSSRIFKAYFHGEITIPDMDIQAISMPRKYFSMRGL